MSNNNLTVTNVINRHNNFVRNILSLKMVFTPEKKIFMIEFYFRNGHENGV
jgi:hypothetical protein